jgi:hypothetical protein
MLANLVRRGSQTRQKIEDSEYKVVRWLSRRQVVLQDKDNGREVPSRNDSTSKMTTTPASSSLSKGRDTSSSAA